MVQNKLISSHDNIFKLAAVGQIVSASAHGKEVEIKQLKLLECIVTIKYYIVISVNLLQHYKKLATVQCF